MTAQPDPLCHCPPLAWCRQPLMIPHHIGTQPSTEPSTEACSAMALLPSSSIHTTACSPHSRKTIHSFLNILCIIPLLCYNPRHFPHLYLPKSHGAKCKCYFPYKAFCDFQPEVILGFTTTFEHLSAVGLPSALSSGVGLHSS